MGKRASKAKVNYTPTAGTRILVLFGGDELLKKTQLDSLAQTLAPEHGDIETFTFEGKSATLAQVFDELRSYALMQSYKFVVVTQADDFIKNHRDALERYWDNPVDHATLILDTQSWPGNTKLAKALATAEHGGAIDCSDPTPADAARWIVQRAKTQHRATLTSQAANLLVQRVGTHLMKLDTEVGKLALLAGEGQPIEPALVEQTIERSSEEAAWVVQEAVLEAIAHRKPGQAVAKIRELIDLARQPEVLVLYFVADLVRKLCVARMMMASNCHQSDIASRLKLFGPRQRLFFQALQNLRGPEAGRLFDQIVRLDARSKSGLGTPTRNLECFAATLVDNSP